MLEHYDKFQEIYDGGWVTAAVRLQDILLPDIERLVSIFEYLEDAGYHYIITGDVVEDKNGDCVTQFSTFTELVMDMEWIKQTIMDKIELEKRAHAD